jgi:hypothetical protein
MAMGRLGTRFREVNWAEQARRLARWQNPVVASPAAPLEAVAALDALAGVPLRTRRTRGARWLRERRPAAAPP